MNNGAIICLIFSIIFSILFFIFLLIKDKGVYLIAGFNILSKEEKDKYNQSAICKDIRNKFLVWTIIFLIGTILSLLISTYISIASFIIWGIFLIKDINFNIEKAYSKYKIK